MGKHKCAFHASLPSVQKAFASPGACSPLLSSPSSSRARQELGQTGKHGITLIPAFNTSRLRVTLGLWELDAVNPSSRIFPWSLVEVLGPFGCSSSNPFDLGPNPFFYSLEGGEGLTDKRFYDKSAQFCFMALSSSGPTQVTVESCIPVSIPHG